jgi:hypothetical protein
MSGQARIEKFTGNDLLVLHLQLLEAAEEPSQSREVVAAFLKRRGYGVNAELIAEVALRLDDEEFPVELIQRELERVALVM